MANPVSYNCISDDEGSDMDVSENEDSPPASIPVQVTFFFLLLFFFYTPKKKRKNNTLLSVKTKTNMNNLKLLA